MRKNEIIRRIWRDEYPPSRPRKHLLIEKVLSIPVVLLRFLSVDQFKSLFSDGGHTFMDCYVLGSLAVLALTLAYPTHFGFIGGLIAAYRIADIMLYRIYFLLIKSQESPWTTVRLRRSLLIVVVNFFESIVAFAILYLVFGHIVATSSVVGTGAFTAGTALYYSVVTAITLGYGNFVPADGISRGIVVVQLFGTLLFLIFVIPALVSIFSTETASQSG